MSARVVETAVFVRASDSKTDKHAALLAYCQLRDEYGVQAAHVVAARNALVQANLDLLHVVARRYRCRSFDLDDLVAYGTLGLIRAIERFDPGRGCALATVAGWWIRAEIGRAVLELDTVVRLPTHLHYERDEGARERLRRMRVVTSLDEPVAGGEGTWSEIVADVDTLDPERALLEHELEVLLPAALADLPERKRRNIRQRLREQGASSAEAARAPVVTLAFRRPLRGGLSETRDETKGPRP